jgi:DeoR family transcriptional regulator, aga operon transcriptional repressor
MKRVPKQVRRSRIYRDSERKLGLQNGSQMLVEERRQYISNLAQEQGRVLVTALAKDLGISPLTVRKDLDDLQERGILQRTHGGALLSKTGTLSDPSFKEKQRRNAEEKHKIAEAAAGLVQEGQCVLLDSGTTTMAVAKALKRFRHLTVVTNSINIVAELGSTNFEILVTGGSFRKNSSSLVGPLAEDTLRDIHADILFLGVDGFDLDIGVSTPNLLASRVNRAMVGAATTVIVVCDSTKFNRKSLSKIVDVTAIHHVITDRNLPASTAEAIRALNIQLTLV